jgi:hypothetical protein
MPAAASRIFVLRQTGNRYISILDTLGALGEFTTATTTTNGVYDLLRFSDRGEWVYRWDGSTYKPTQIR